ncbi:hypothetical protein [Natrinema gelatinilyticum]|uniref:hypothetical protein n=1 Tax=Natrinema gelatinilyticum TaxID=2961571 RepID=UPI003CE47863
MPDPTVEISATCEDDRVRIAFADDGPGIPPGEIDVGIGESDIIEFTQQRTQALTGPLDDRQLRRPRFVYQRTRRIPRGLTSRMKPTTRDTNH